MSKASLPYQPRLLGAPEAAAYIGVSQSTLRDLGIPRRKLLGRRLYDRIDSQYCTPRQVYSATLWVAAAIASRHSVTARPATAERGHRPRPRATTRRPMQNNLRACAFSSCAQVQMHL